MKFSLILLSLLALSLPLLSPLHIHTGAVEAASDEPRELEAFQGYLDPAPIGMDVRYAWTLPGGRGENVKIIDIEFNWNLEHNDLVAVTSNPLILIKGIDPLPADRRENLHHGTAVLGELIAAPDGIGVTGIAHRAKIGLINPLTSGSVPKVAEAIRLAAEKLSAGDVILVEQQSVAGPRFDPSIGLGYLPIEYEAAVFEAIKEATSRGIVVVEPAGNGYDNLDHPAYNGAFDRNKRDSGAIIVGSGLPEGGVYGPGPDRTRTAESNFGSRVDVQGWGRFITTCGYGPLREEQGLNNIYTIDFGATSGAAAMVAGAAAIIQSIVKERGLAPLTPLQMRRLLISTGSPQTGNRNQNIGPRPDLRAALAALDPGDQQKIPVITAIKYKRSKGRLTIDGENFLPDDSVIEIDGTKVERIKYPSEYLMPNGTTTRLMTKKNVSELLPAGETVSIIVFTPSTGKRSEPFPFRNE